MKVFEVYRGDLDEETSTILLELYLKMGTISKLDLN